MLDSAEAVYRQIEPGNDVHLTYIVQSSLAKIAIRRMGATKVEKDIDDAFEQIEDFYYKALEQIRPHYPYCNYCIAYCHFSDFGFSMDRMQKQRQEAEYQKTQLHQANEVVISLQNFILERTEVMKKLNQGGDSLIVLNPREWSEIERTLNAIDNNRFARLREVYPNMAEDDVRLCILTRLGISNRTIGNIYCITISAVQHRKLKLKKNVFGETDPDITLEQILTK